MKSAVIILAAGLGTRMESELPKVLHKVASSPLLIHSIQTALDINAEKIIIVAGHGAELVKDVALDYNHKAEIVIQSEQLGTAHAVDQAREALKDFDGDVFVLYGDTPFIDAEILTKMSDARTDGASIVVLGFETEIPSSYGRLILESNGDLDAIIEAKDTNKDQKKINFCNSGVICAPRKLLFE